VALVEQRLSELRDADARLKEFRAARARTRVGRSILAVVAAIVVFGLARVGIVVKPVHPAAQRARGHCSVSPGSSGAGRSVTGVGWRDPQHRLDPGDPHV